MIVTTSVAMRNNVFTGTVSTEADSLDTKYMNQFGEPSIDKLGTIPNGEGTFELTGGPSLVKVRSGMPIEFALDANIDAEAAAKVAAWCAEMADRIQTVMTTLKGQALPTSPTVTFYTA